MTGGTSIANWMSGEEHAGNPDCHGTIRLKRVDAGTGPSMYVQMNILDQIDQIDTFLGGNDCMDEHSLMVLRGKLLQLRVQAAHELSDKEKAIHDLAALVTHERKNRLVARQLRGVAA